MALVIVETLADHFPTPDQPTDQKVQVLSYIAERNGSWQYSLLSSDRRRMVCIYDAPDAEAVRESYRKGGESFKRIWSGVIITPEGSPPSRNQETLKVFESTYPEGFTWEQWDESVSHLLPCYAEEGAEWVCSYVSLDHTRVVCEYNAPDAEVIRGAHRRFGIPFDRAWSAMVIKP